ncbi:MAG: lysophospholipid acyltransferase family protein [Bacteroidia bacterium]
MYPFLIYFLADRKRYKHAFTCQRIMARWICFFSGIYVKRHYEISSDDPSLFRRTPCYHTIKNIKTKHEIPHPAVIVSNHASYLDGIVNYLLTKNYFVCMAKSEIKKAPLFNIFFRDMQITVDRSSVTSSHKAFMRAAQEIDKGNSLFIFPEGATSPNGELKNFKNGPFRIAIEKQVPIVPVTFVNNWKLMQKGGFFTSYGRPGISTVVIHKPISTVGLREENIVDLRQQVFAIINNTLINYKL